jgi:RNA polymerase sigma-70 factor, ECF subfamily
VREAGIREPGFERFYEEEAGRVFATVFLLCRDRETAEDATQEAFARAYERWSGLGQAPWAGGWVTTTAMNLARRSLRRHHATPTQEGGFDPQAAVDLWQTVRDLPRRQQEAVVLHYRLGTPVDEIAKLMQCEPGTVRTHLSRARAALRQALAESDRT